MPTSFIDSPKGISGEGTKKLSKFDKLEIRPQLLICTCFMKNQVLINMGVCVLKWSFPQNFPKNQDEKQ